MRSSGEAFIKIKTTSLKKSAYIRAAKKEGLNISGWVDKTLSEAAASEIDFIKKNGRRREY